MASSFLRVSRFIRKPPCHVLHTCARWSRMFLDVLPFPTWYVPHVHARVPHLFHDTNNALLFFKLFVADHVPHVLAWFPPHFSNSNCS